MRSPHAKLELISRQNLCGLEPQLIKLEFIIYLPKLKVSRLGVRALRAWGPWARRGLSLGPLGLGARAQGAGRGKAGRGFTGY